MEMLNARCTQRGSYVWDAHGVSGYPVDILNGVEAQLEINVTRSYTALCVGSTKAHKSRLTKRSFVVAIKTRWQLIQRPVQIWVGPQKARLRGRHANTLHAQDR